MIYVTGGTPNQRKYAESITLYCIKKFLPRYRVLDIEIKIKRFKKDEFARGYCCKLDTREFEIEVDRTLRMREMLTTIAHEMVHVKQYVLKEFHDDVEHNVNYWERPSEIEAHGRERGLFEMWAEQEQLLDKNWAKYY